MKSNKVTYIYIRMNLWQEDQKNLQIQVAFHPPFLAIPVSTWYEKILIVKLCHDTL